MNSQQLTDALQNELELEKITLSLKDNSPLMLVNNNNLAGMDTRISTVMSNEIARIKDIHIVNITKYFEDVKQATVNFINVSPLNNFKINYLDLPENVLALEASGLMTVLNGQESLGLAAVGNGQTLGFTNMSLDAFKEIVKSGYTASVGEEALSEFKDSELLDFMEMYLVDISEGNGNYKEFYRDPSVYLNKAVLLFLFAMGALKNEDALNYVTVGLKKFEEHLSLLKKWSAIRTTVSIKSIKNFNENGVLITKHKDNEVYLNSKVYKEFIKDHSIETILGYVVSGGYPRATLEGILKDSDKFDSAWKNYVSTSVIATKNNAATKLKTAYQLHLKALLSEMSDEDFAVYNVDKLSIINVELPLLLKEKNIEELLDILTMCETILCKLLYKNDNTENFIKYMKKFANMDKDIDQKLAASYASLEIIVDYLFQGISARKVQD